MNMTTQQFIEKARKIHGDKYDYSKVNYINSKTKVCIICPKHGEFWQIPLKHIGTRKQGCRKCADELHANKKRKTTQQFIEEAKKIHGDKYDYSKVEYKNNHTKVCIICPEHGEFWKTPTNHLKGEECTFCSNEKFSIKIRDTKEEFINKCKNRYGNKYCYDKVEYIDSYTPVTIICPIHGNFKVKPNDFLQGIECKTCKKENFIKNKRISFEEFVKRAKEIHGDKYLYHEEDYTELCSKTRITCPIHGDFWQLAMNHISKTNHRGCPTCKESKLEKHVRNFLMKNNIKFISQYKCDFSKNGKGYMALDFYLTKWNIAIECQGEQHFKPISTFGGENGFKLTHERDKRKKALCKDNNIKIYYYTELKDYDTFLGEKLYKNINELYQAILTNYNI